MMKKSIAAMLAVIMLCMTACAPVGGNTSTTAPETTVPETTVEATSVPETTAPVVKNENTYNIIFAMATIPPVLAALDSIDNGYETYAIIERGKTYSGIDSVENFHNAGFDPANNLSEGFTDTELDAIVAKVKELNENNEDAFFNIYVQDGTALIGAAIAANAGLTTEQFHIYMVEDGTGAYDALNTYFVKGKSVTESTDEVYDNYIARVAAMETRFADIMSKQDNVVTVSPEWYDFEKSYALAALDNFTFYIQDEARIIEILESTGDVKTKLLSCFGAEGYDAEVDYKLNLKYQKIVDGVTKLTETERTAYLTLMYGQYYEDTYAALTRTQRADEAAPAKKLVFIGTRHGGYPAFASNPVYGVGGLAADAEVPTTYAELDAKYKSSLIFGTEEDYNAFLAELNDDTNYTADVTDEAKKLAKVATFNDYIDYMFTLKFTYAMYGADYDLIMKGHPREVIGGHEEWGGKYVVNCSDGTSYIYDKLMDNVLLNFHANDTVGKYIGMVPYGTAAENLAFLGADMAICGLPSSTYNGYATDVDVLYIMTETDQDIMGSGSAEVASSVSTRYEAGNLLYTNASGEKVATVFFNTGNVYKYAAQLHTAAGNTELADAYNNLFNNWLSAVHSGASNIDDQGFAVE